MTARWRRRVADWLTADDLTACNDETDVLRARIDRLRTELDRRVDTRALVLLRSLLARPEIRNTLTTPVLGYLDAEHRKLRTESARVAELTR